MFFLIKDDFLIKNIILILVPPINNIYKSATYDNIHLVSSLYRILPI